MPSKVKKPIFEPPARFVSERVLSLDAKVVEKYVPDKLLLLLVNAVDKRASPRKIDAIVDMIQRHISAHTLASLISVADEYVPDTVASSRKVSTVIAGVGKYVPDNMIPPESADNWSNLKVKFHIPTLLLRKAKDNPP